MKKKLDYLSDNIFMRLCVAARGYTYVWNDAPGGKVYLIKVWL